MQADIGNAAGVIWRHLDQHGAMPLSRLRKDTKLTDQLLFMGLGWLAREEKVDFVKEGRSVHVRVRAA